MDPGDSFYVWARLVGTADQIGQVDAWTTLTASLTNTAGLVPAAAVVPEPALAWLLCACAPACAARLRRALPAGD